MSFFLFQSFLLQATTTSGFTATSEINITTEAAASTFNHHFLITSYNKSSPSAPLDLHNWMHLLSRALNASSLVILDLEKRKQKGDFIVKLADNIANKDCKMGHLGQIMCGKSVGGGSCLIQANFRSHFLPNIVIDDIKVVTNLKTCLLSTATTTTRAVTQLWPKYFKVEAEAGTLTWKQLPKGALSRPNCTKFKLVDLRSKESRPPLWLKVDVDTLLVLPFINKYPLSWVGGLVALCSHQRAQQDLILSIYINITRSLWEKNQEEMMMMTMKMFNFNSEV